MARNTKVDHDGDKGRIRFFYGEVEGNNQTLQDAMRNFVAAANRPIITQIPRRPAAISELPTSSSADLFSGVPVEEAEVVDAPVDQSTATEPHTNGSARRRRGEGQKIDHNAGLSPVGSLELSPKGKASLRDFVAQKSPKTDEQFVLVIIYYLKQVLAEQTIGANHVLTGFKNIGSKRVPADLRGTIRNVAKKKAWLSATDFDNIEITNAGIEVVDHDLPTPTNGDKSA